MRCINKWPMGASVGLYNFTVMHKNPSWYLTLIRVIHE